ncbi:MAG TPA: hypothetical protein VIS48_04180 [Candidatus Kryptonia bacterium]
MGKKRHTVESIVAMLREAEVQMAKGQTLAEVVQQLGISDTTYYHEVMASPQMEKRIRSMTRTY